MNQLTDTLVYLIVFAAFLQISIYRVYPALIFAGMTLAHSMVSDGFEPVTMYLSAAVTDLLIISLVMVNSSDLTRKLILISIASIILNGAGWLLWRSYNPPFLYDIAFVVLYTYTIVVMLRGSGDVGDHTGSWHNSWVFGRFGKGHRNLHGVEKHK